jgi:hypothetical protein
VIHTAKEYVAAMLTVAADNLPRLMNCNGSRNMAAAFPRETVEQIGRDEGIAAHWMAATAFNGADLNSLVNMKHSNGVIMTGEMADHVYSYLHSLDCGEIEANTSFAGATWEVRGRCDHRKLNLSASTLTIDDFKYGWTLVEPEMNWTLIAHAAGTLIASGTSVATIILRIHQPRPHHSDGKVREWRITYEHLMSLYAQIDATLTNPTNELRTGLSWCRRCHALANCPAARAASMNAIDATTLQFSDELSNDVVAFELDTLRAAQSMLSSRLSALEEMAIYRLKTGAVIPGYGAETQFANTRFVPGISPVALSIASGIDCTKPGMITPAEFKRRGGSQTVYDALTERPITGVKLVRASADKRAQRLLPKER